MRGWGNHRGFTLMEIVVAVALVAIMAGSIAPVVWRQVNAGRSRATTDEQRMLKTGLLAFYEDVGRFPTEAEGLLALVADPGVKNWSGPYVQTVHENPADAVRTDAFGRAYVYDLKPKTKPKKAATVLVASGGANLVLDAGKLNKKWLLTNLQDDLIALVNSSPLDRGKTQLVQIELEAIAAACRSYFADHMSFPNKLDDLQGKYLDPGFSNAAFTDAWTQSYRLYLFAGKPQIQMRVYSYGPNQKDDNGKRDDLSVLVNSIPVGRSKSQEEINICQAVLDANPKKKLKGKWKKDRKTLGLAIGFDLDGWGTRYGINKKSRYVYSVGPDGNPRTTGDNVPAGFGP